MNFKECFSINDQFSDGNMQIVVGLGEDGFKERFLVEMQVFFLLQ